MCVCVIGKVLKGIAVLTPRSRSEKNDFYMFYNSYFLLLL